MVATYLPGRQSSTLEQESLQALDLIRHLSGLMRQGQPFQLCVVDGEHEELIELPSDAAPPFMDILEAIAAKRGVTITAEPNELTTRRAAEILHVSHPFLIKLLGEGKISYHKVGRHRRVRLEDVLAYKEETDRKREAVLDQLVADAQEQGGMGYD